MKGQALGFVPLNHDANNPPIHIKKSLSDRAISLDPENIRNYTYPDEIFLIDHQMNTRHNNHSNSKKDLQENSPPNKKRAIFPLINLQKPLFQNKGIKVAADTLEKAHDSEHVLSFKNSNGLKFIDRIGELEAIKQRINEKEVFSRFENKQALYFSNEDKFKFKISMVYKKGEIFGSEWSNFKHKRAMSMIAEEELYLLYVERDHFIEAVNKEKLRIKDKIEFMAKVFKDTEFTDVTEISCHLVEQKYDFNDLIFYEGQQTQGFYFVKQGEVEVIFFI